MNSLRLLLAICLAVPFSHAQTTPATATKKPSALAKINVPGTENFKPDQPVVLAPKLVKQPEPEFPKQSIKHNLSGTVNVTITVDEAGMPQNVQVDAPVGHGFDEAALKAVRQYRFEPATRDGKPVAVALHIEVAFQRYSGAYNPR